MDVIQQILAILKKIGIPIVIVVLIIGGFISYRNYLEIKLLGLQIKQAKKDLLSDNKDTPS